MSIQKPTEKLLNILKHRRFHAVLALLMIALGISWVVEMRFFQGSILKQSVSRSDLSARKEARRRGRLSRRGIVGKPSNFSFLGNPFSLLHGSADDAVPVFGRAVFPVDRVPNWGAMRSSSEWDRSYAEMTDADFVPIPAYDLSQLTIPMETLTHPLLDASIPTITAKLFYSTRYFAAYDVDAGEFTGAHDGVDLKLPLGTPVRAIGGGVVRFARDDDGPFGLHVIIEHRLENGEKYFSIYGHLSRVIVKEGDAVEAMRNIGEVGSTGDSTGPHLHLQIDRDDGALVHTPFAPLVPPSRAQAEKYSENPIRFIQDHASVEN